MSTPDLTHTAGLTYQPAPATLNLSDSAAEAGMAHALSTQKNTVPGALDLSWISDEQGRLLES